MNVETEKMYPAAKDVPVRPRMEAIGTVMVGGEKRLGAAGETRSYSNGKSLT